MTSVMFQRQVPLSHNFEVFSTNEDLYTEFKFSDWEMPQHMDIDVGKSSPVPSDSSFSSDSDCMTSPSANNTSDNLSNPSSPDSSTSYEKLSRANVSLKEKMSSSGGKQQYTAELEVACRICGDRASGFHYGVHSCEGCKGFFRRTLKKQLKYKPCKGGVKCRIDSGNRNKCQFCRYQRCINAGMSPDAVRFGRMPKIEREKLMADKAELSNNSKKRILDLRTLSDTIKTAFKETLKMADMMLDNTNDNSSANKKECLEETCIVNTLNSEEFKKLSVFQCYQQMVVPLVEASVRFAKKLPGFLELPLNDQILLMKQGALAVTLVMMHSMVDRFTIKLKGRNHDLVINRKAVSECRESRLLLQQVLTVCDRITDLQLQPVELALFAGVILLSDTPDLANGNGVEKNQMEILDALRLEVNHNHPKQRTVFPKLLVLITDLRQIVEDFQTNLTNRIFDPTTNLSNTEPLLKEIFNLC